MKITEKDEKIKIGQIVNAVALRGEVKVYNYSEPQRFEELEEIRVGNEVKKIEKVRYQNNMVILKLEGVDDRNAAEALKGKDIFIGQEDLRELPDDTYYIKDLIGLDVIDEGGNIIGKMKDVIQNSAQDLYEIEKTSGGTFLVPAVAKYVGKVDLEKGTVEVLNAAELMDL
ncbi:MAG: ribosome maturation factor RimM [Clostridia bacterium]|nr:ribosome maturation factor RimM [Clostridia bacterium]